MYALDGIVAKRTCATKGIWIHGNPGTGKSHFVRSWCELKGLTLFVKP
jgi:predicted PilT family ATPase